MTPSPKERAEAVARPIVDRIASYVGCMFYEDAHNPIALKLAEIFAPAITAALLAARAEQARENSLAWSHFDEWFTATIEEFKPVYDEKTIGGMQFFAGVVSDKAYAAKAAADELEKQAREIAP